MKNYWTDSKGVKHEIVVDVDDMLRCMDYIHNTDQRPLFICCENDDYLSTMGSHDARKFVVNPDEEMMIDQNGQDVALYKSKWWGVLLPSGKIIKDDDTEIRDYMVTPKSRDKRFMKT
jgi:hypothetical protein